MSIGKETVVSEEIRHGGKKGREIGKENVEVEKLARGI